MAEKKTWMAIVISLMAVAGLAVVLIVGGSIYWITRHVDTEVTSPANAAEEFARERARFAGVLPVLQVSGGANPKVQQLPDGSGSPGRSGGPLDTLHARFFDPEDGKIVRADVPFWLIRTVNSLAVLPHMGSITLEEIEKHGPGLMVNGTGEDGEQILVWID
jgi:hypothetical protein